MHIQKLISYIFYPIIFPFIGSVLYFILSPKYTSSAQEYAVLFTIFISTYIIPLLFMAILKQSKMIKSYHLTTVIERKFPLLFLITLFFLLGNMLYKTGFISILAFYFFGIAFALVLAYFFLFFKKRISLYMLSIGSLLGFMFVFSFLFKLNLLIVISIIVLLSGAIAMSRINLKAHNNTEVFLGFLIGLFAQLFVSFIEYKISNQHAALSSLYYFVL